MLPRWSKPVMAAGCALLIVSLAARHCGELGALSATTIVLTSWLGSLLVIVGVGSVLFLE